MVEEPTGTAASTTSAEPEGDATPGVPLLFVVPGPAGVPAPERWAPPEWRVRRVGPEEALRRADEADAVLLPPDVATAVARRLGERLPGRVLLWSWAPRPVLELRAADLGLAGTVPLDEPAHAALALARLRAHRHEAWRDGPAAGVTVPWRSDGVRLHLDGDTGDLVSGEVVRALVTAALVEHRGRGGAHFHRAVPVRASGRAVRVEVRGTLSTCGDARGTVAVLPDAPRPLGLDHDALTGLPGRDAFVRRIAALRRSPRRAQAVLCLDLDDFGALNDGLGPEVGDLLLRWTADRLRELLPGHLVARVGSDEFAVLLDGAGTRAAVLAEAEAALAALGDAVFLAGHLVYPSAKAGLAFLDRPRRGAAPDVFRDAQSAMGRAKASRSTGLVVFDGEMRRRHLEAVRLDRDLRHAVATGALDVHFQPIVAVPTRDVRGYEALLRWRHPERGVVPPSAFVPVAERNGLILPIGRWVLERACAAVRALHLRRPDLGDVHVSVNLSPVQLRQPDLVAQVEAVLEASGLEPARLSLELTERAVMSHAEPVLAVLHRLRRLGVRILLDDFGTGYSALEYLVRLPADVLKIDRSFVDGLGVDPRRTRVVCTIVDLARSLGMALVAEGVETEEQLLWLEQLGVECAQGFLLGGPVPETALGGPPSGTVSAAS